MNNPTTRKGSVNLDIKPNDVVRSTFGGELGGLKGGVVDWKYEEMIGTDMLVLELVIPYNPAELKQAASSIVEFVFTKAL